jgi:predicted TIM-barrel fold metal-dependent hydrolase
MFESNFPPDKASCSYGTLLNAFKKVAAAAGLSPVEKRAVFHDNAARVYRLRPADAGAGAAL